MIKNYENIYENLLNTTGKPNMHLTQSAITCSKLARETLEKM